MKRLTNSVQQGCINFIGNSLPLFLFVITFAVPSFAASDLVSANKGLLKVEQQILRTSEHLNHIADEVRSAIEYLEEKELELAEAHQLYRDQPTERHDHSLHHAQKRVALARLGLDSRVARFERIQHQLEQLALAKFNLMANHAQALTAAEDVATVENVAIAEDEALADGAPPESMAMTSSSHDEEQVAPATTDQLAREEPEPSNPALAEPEPPQLNVQNAKIFGPGIPGEISLEPAGANQFIGRFVAPSNNLSLFVGFRTDQYHSKELSVQLSEHEYGQPFVFVLDFSDPEQPHTRVFEESLLTTEEEISSIYSAL